MGWTGTKGRTVNDELREIRAGWEQFDTSEGWENAKPTGKRVVCLSAHVVKERDGHTIYALMGIGEPGDPAPPAEFIMVTLCEYQRGYLMVKTMDNSVGPYFYQVPVEWLDQLPPAKPGSMDEEWRAECRQKAAECPWVA